MKIEAIRKPMSGVLVSLLPAHWENVDIGSGKGEGLVGKESQNPRDASETYITCSGVEPSGLGTGSIKPGVRRLGQEPF